MIKAFVKTYPTYEEADLILNPVLSNEDKEEISNRYAEEAIQDKIMREQIAKGLEIQEENTKKLTGLLY